MRIKISLIALMLFMLSISVSAQTTLFNYQGKLNDGGVAANGSYDLQFKLFDTIIVGTGTQLFSQTVSNVTVADGIFTVPLNFGTCLNCFNGAARFLEIAIKPTSGGVFTTLGPRQQITSTPYAIKSLNAATADGVSPTCVSCVTSSQIQSVSGSVVTGEIPVASVPSGNPSYIQNGTSPQSPSNFNISGNGTIGGTLNSNVVNATTQYNLAGQRVISATTSGGGANLFVGINAGSANSGFSNTFVGKNAGQSNTCGPLNTFVGSDAGMSNTTGDSNTFIGDTAGASNTTGVGNTFVGKSTGFDNKTGSNNTIVGIASGTNTTGSNNTFIGAETGVQNITGSNNTTIGRNASVGQSNLTFATAIGSGAIVSNNSSVVLGRSDGSDTVRIPGAVIIDDTLIVKTLGGTGITDLCLNLASRLATCSSSLRYKSNVTSFFGGLDVVRHLRPIRFTWKEGGVQDIGFAAEEVNDIEPLLATHNKQGEIEGVKYGQLTTVLVNAVKDQQAQIETQQTQIQSQQLRIEELQKRIAGLTAAICQSNPRAGVCNEK
jgi:hypothetical protein